MDKLLDENQVWHLRWIWLFLFWLPKSNSRGLGGLFKNTIHNTCYSRLISSPHIPFRNHIPGEHGERYMPNMTNLLNPEFLFIEPVLFRCRYMCRSHTKLFFLKCTWGSSLVMQWVKNRADVTASAQVTAVAWLWSLVLGLPHAAGLAPSKKCTVNHLWSFLKNSCAQALHLERLSKSGAGLRHMYQIEGLPGYSNKARVGMTLLYIQNPFIYF